MCGRSLSYSKTTQELSIPRRFFLKNYHRPHFTVGGKWNKSLHLQQLQRCYCESSGSPASAYVIRRHYSITYTQSLQVINGLLAVGRGETYFMDAPRISNYFALHHFFGICINNAVVLRRATFVSPSIVLGRFYKGLFQLF